MSNIAIRVAPGISTGGGVKEPWGVVLFSMPQYYSGFILVSNAFSHRAACPPFLLDPRKGFGVCKTAGRVGKTHAGNPNVRGAPMKDFQVKEMFERIAFSYDMQNSVLSLGIDILWRKRLARMAALPPNGLCLDAAVGTAEVSFDLLRSRPGARVLGVDFSPAMLTKAREKRNRRAAGERLRLVCGDCRALPVADATADAVTIAFGIRNIAERVQVLSEFFRVLKPGGRALVMDFGIPPNPLLAKLYRLYFDHVLPPLGNFLSKTDYAYSYLVESVDAFPDDASFLAEMRQAGFQAPCVTHLTFGVARIFRGEKAP